MVDQYDYAKWLSKFLPFNLVTLVHLTGFAMKYAEVVDCQDITVEELVRMNRYIESVVTVHNPVNA